MLRGIALAKFVLPLEFAAGMQMFNRGGEPEVCFFLRGGVLPVWDEGRMRKVAWGCRCGESQILPSCSSTWLATVQAGGWDRFRTRLVDIPATLILEGDV